jgi:hypothetical protein
VPLTVDVHLVYEVFAQRDPPPSRVWTYVQHVPTKRVRSVGVSYQVGRPTLSIMESGSGVGSEKYCTKYWSAEGKKNVRRRRDVRPKKIVRVTFLRVGGGAHNLLNTVHGSNRGSKIIVWLQ